jgi:hypothetical protein
MTKIDYQWSDAWLLQSIIVGGGKDGATLFNIISAGDAINVAIFTDDELESGFSRLSGGELIIEKENKFFPTAKAIGLYEQASKRGGSIFTIRERLQKLLKASPYDSKQPYPNPKNDLSYPGFSKTAVEKAIDQWHKEAKELSRVRSNLGTA